MAKIQASSPLWKLIQLLNLTKQRQGSELAAPRVTGAARANRGGGPTAPDLGAGARTGWGFGGRARARSASSFSPGSRDSCHVKADTSTPDVRAALRARRAGASRSRWSHRSGVPPPGLLSGAPPCKSSVQEVRRAWSRTSRGPCRTQAGL